MRRSNAGRIPWGWQVTRFEGHLLQPRYSTLMGVPLAWAPATKGKISGTPIYLPMQTAADCQAQTANLNGKIVLMRPPRTLQPADAPLFRRLTAEELATAEAATGEETPDSEVYLRRPPPPGTKPRTQLPDFAALAEARRTLNACLSSSGVALAIYPSTFSESGTVAAQWGGGIEADHPAPPSVALAVEHYNRLQRLSEHGIPAQVEFEVTVQTQPSVAIENLIAELPGTHPEEIVMIGAHVDSWHGGTGATDNAAGAAIAIAALRILKAVNVPLRRTVRLALWSGEEQGELGSKAFVNALPKEKHGIAVYMNLDSGAGRIRGVYTHGNRDSIPMLRKWLEPWNKLGVTAVSARRLAGSDHSAFAGAGIPVLSFIQDPLDYAMRTWHTSMDVFDRLQPDDLKQASAVTAAMLFHLANGSVAIPTSAAVAGNR